MRKVISALSVFFIMSCPLFPMDGTHPDPSPAQEYKGPSAAVSLGTPGLVNITMGAVGERLGLWVTTSFMYFFLDSEGEDDSNAYYNEMDDEDDDMLLVYQINLACRLYGSRDWSLITSIVFGQYVYYKNDNLKKNLIYFGPAIELRYKNFFLEVGVGYSPSEVFKGSNNFFTHMVPVFQIGACIGF